MNPFSRRSYIGPMLLCLAGALIACTAAEAATVTVTWTNPVQNTDDTAIPATGDGSLQSWRSEYGTCSAPGVFGTRVGDLVRPRATPTGPLLTTATFNLPVGQSCVRQYVSNSYAKESDPSNVVVRVVDAPTPKPPALTSAAPQVFDVKPNEQTFAFDRGRQVGTVKLGAACDEDRTTGDDFYALERPSRVKLTREPRSTALVARCAPDQAARVDAGEASEALDDGDRVLMGSRLYPAS